MTCTSCGTENRAGAKFCIECGTQFAAPCPSCGTANPSGAKFCSECATPLLDGARRPGDGPSGASPDARQIATPATAERRVVSVLFADLVGWTTLAADRDSEDARELLTRYFDVA